MTLRAEARQGELKAQTKEGGREGGAYLVHRPNLGREPTMDTQHLPVNQCGEVEVIEDVDAVLPGVGVPILAHAFLVEAVHLGWEEGGREGEWIRIVLYQHRPGKSRRKFGIITLPPSSGPSLFLLSLPPYLRNLPRLMIPPQQSHMLGIPCLQTQQQRQGLHAIVTPVHKIAHENVARLRYFPPTSKKLEQVEELAVDVPAHRDGAPHRLDVAFFDEDFFDLLVGESGGEEERGGRGVRTGRRKRGRDEGEIAWGERGYKWMLGSAL